MAPAKKKTNPAIPILIVVALIAVGAGAFFLLSGDDDGGDPAAVAEDFYNAVQQGDCQSAGNLLSSASVESMGGPEAAIQQCEESQTTQGELVATEVISETDTNATVAVEYRQDDGSTDSTEINLVDEDGDWRVDFSGSSAPQPDGGGNGGGGDGGGGNGGTAPPSTSPTTDSGGSSSGSGGGSGGGGGARPGEPPGSTSLSAALSDADPEDIPLAEACGAGDLAACDSLWPQTPVDSNIEAWAESCGGVDPGVEHHGDCVETLG